MKKEMGEQLSAFVDDELMVREEAMLVGRLCTDDDCREVVYRYALMGSAMRSQRGDLLGAELADRIRADVDKEAGHQRPAYSRVSGLLKPAAGLGVAAGVAAVAIMSLSGNVDGPVSLSDPVTIAVTSEDSTVVPLVPAGTSNTVNLPARLTNYMIQHSEFSPALGRRNVLAEIIGQENNILESDKSESKESEAEDPSQ